MPPASTWPLAAQSDGLPSRGISRKKRRKQVAGEVLLDQRRVGGEAAQVGAGAEDLLPRAGQDDRADRLVVARSLHRVDQLAEHLVESALRCSGRFRVTVATPPETS